MGLPFASVLIATSLRMVGCARPGNRVVSIESAGDFRFRFEYGSCAKAWIDTMAGLYTRDLGPAETATVGLRLPQEQMDRIEHALEEVGFFDLASPFNAIPAGVLEVQTTRPSRTYHLEVHQRGAVHVVDWDDAHRPTTELADRFRVIVQMIEQVVETRPALASVPQPNIGCM